MNTTDDSDLIISTSSSENPDSSIKNPSRTPAVEESSVPVAEKIPDSSVGGNAPPSIDASDASGASNVSNAGSAPPSIDASGASNTSGVSSASEASTGPIRINRPDAEGRNFPLGEPKLAKKEKKKKKRHPVLRTLLIIFLLSLATLAAGGYIAYHYAYDYYMSSTAVSTTAPATMVLYDTAVPEADFHREGDQLLLSYEFVKTNIDPSIYWEADSGKIIVTTADKVFELDTGELTAYVNSQAITLDIPVTLYDGVPFVPIDFFASVYGVEIVTTDAGITVIDDMKKPILSMKVKDTVIMPELEFLKNVRYLGTLSYFQDFPYLRESASFQSPRIRELVPGDEVIVVGEENNWYKVRCLDGVFGYIKKSQVILDRIIPARMEKTAYKTPWAPVGDKINLTWDYMSVAKKDMSTYVSIPGLNVISPTWFSLSDTKGNIKNLASKVYVEWAHSQGLQVWALCSNGFDPDLTTPFLRSYELRKKFIQQLLVFADTYGFDGINLDFENIYLADKDYLTQFVREMVPYMHEQGLTVSMDVTIRSQSENWSMVYDRIALSEAVDYMAVMTYDEHWQLTKDPGSVASLPWVEKGLIRILEQIPKEKLLLGVPYYTRLWKEETAADGTVTISTQTLSMGVAQQWLIKRNVSLVQDEESGQNYGEYTSGNITQKVWMEDEYSMRKRIKLAREYELAGVASWRLGFETPDIWTVIEEELTKMP